MNESNHYLKRLRISLLTLLISGCTFAADSLPEVEVIIRSGSQFSICQDYAQVLQEHRAPTANYCGVAVPIENSDYGLPVWRDIDPAQNMEIIRKMYYWYNLRSTIDSELYHQQFQDVSVIMPELLELVWTPVEEKVIQLISEGQIYLQEGNFDVDFDAENERVYRMSDISRIPYRTEVEERIGPGVRVTNTCDDYGLPGGDRNYIYYVDVDELSGQNYEQFYSVFRLRMSGFFSWKDRIYWATGGAIYEPHTFDYDGLRQVCGILARPVMQEGSEK